MKKTILYAYSGKQAQDIIDFVSSFANSAKKKFFGIDRCPQAGVHRVYFDLSLWRKETKSVYATRREPTFNVDQMVGAAQAFVRLERLATKEHAADKRRLKRLAFFRG